MAKNRTYNVVFLSVPGVGIYSMLTTYRTGVFLQPVIFIKSCKYLLFVRYGESILSSDCIGVCSNEISCLEVVVVAFGYPVASVESRKDTDGDQNAAPPVERQ